MVVYIFLNIYIYLFLQDIQESGDFLIKPESKVASLDTSQWPLLLKVSFLCACHLICRSRMLYLK